MSEKVWQKLPLFLLGGVALILAILLPFGATLGPIDDHNILATLQQGGTWINFMIIPSIGRFVPLNGIEYWFVAKFLGNTPMLYYGVNALQLLILFGAMFWLVSRTTKNTVLTAGALAVFLFLPGFMESFFRLFVLERNVVFYLALFLVAYVWNDERPSAFSLVASVVFANIAIYYKEPVFILIGAFAFLHLVFAWRKLSASQKALDFLLMASGLLFVGIYYVQVYSHIGPHRYGENLQVPLMFLAKNLLRYVFYDPLMALGLPAFLIIRASLIIRRKDKFDALFDSAAIAAFLYFLVFLKLNIHSVYYLLPLYPFVLPAFAKLIEEHVGLWRHPVSYVLTGGLLLLVISSSLHGGYRLAKKKYIPVNYNLALNQLVSSIKAAPGHRHAIFVEGLHPNSGVEIYESLSKFLVYRGLATADFDLKSNLAPDAGIFVRTDSHSPYTVFRDLQPKKEVPGDYLMITPFTDTPISPERLVEIKKTHRLLLQTHSPLGIPNLAFQEVFRRGQERFDGSDYYVFQRMVP